MSREKSSIITLDDLLNVNPIYDVVKYTKTSVLKDYLLSQGQKIQSGTKKSDLINRAVDLLNKDKTNIENTPEPEQRLKYSDDFISFQVINTALSLKDSYRNNPPNLRERLESEKAQNLGIEISQKVMRKPKPGQRIEKMQNQISIRVGGIKGTKKDVHIMLFTNYSMTLTGIRHKKQAQLATKRLLLLFPELEHTKPLNIRNTTLHYSLGFSIHPFQTAQLLQQMLPSEYTTCYRPDVGTSRTVRVLYNHKSEDSNTFIIQKSGKIMQSVTNFQKRQLHFNVLVDTLIKNRKKIERVKDEIDED